MESLSKYHLRSSHKFEHNTVPPSGFSVQPVFPLGVELVLPRGLGVELRAVLLPGGPRGLLCLLPPGFDLFGVWLARDEPVGPRPLLLLPLQPHSAHPIQSLGLFLLGLGLFL